MARNSTTATPYIDKQFSQDGCWRTTRDMWAAQLHAIIATATAHVADGSFHFLEKVVDTPTPLRDLSEHCQQLHKYKNVQLQTIGQEVAAPDWAPRNQYQRKPRHGTAQFARNSLPALHA